jgi:hypothetical protein
MEELISICNFLSSIHAIQTIVIASVGRNGIEF